MTRSRSQYCGCEYCDIRFPKCFAAAINTHSLSFSLNLVLLFRLILYLMLHPDSILIVIEQERLSPAHAPDKTALVCVLFFFFYSWMSSSLPVHHIQREWNCLYVKFDFPTSFPDNGIPPSSEVVNCLLREKEWTSCSSIISGLSGGFFFVDIRAVHFKVVSIISVGLWSVLIYVHA